MPAAYDRSKWIAELRLRNDAVQRIRNGRTPPCDFELPSKYPPKADAIPSGAEETDVNSNASSEAEDELVIVKNTSDLDGDQTGYTESV